MADDGFGQELAQLVRQLLEESHRESNPISAAIRAHVGEGIDELPVHGEQLPIFELANLQLALDAALARPGYEARVIGVAGHGRHYSDLGLADLVSVEHLGIGAPEYVEEPVGPKQTLRALSGPSCS